MKERLRYVYDDILMICMNQWFNIVDDFWNRQDYERLFIWLSPDLLFMIPWWFEVVVLGRHLGKESVDA